MSRRADTGRSLQPLVAGDGQKVNAQRCHIDVEGPRRLSSVDKEEGASASGQRSDLSDGKECPGDVAGVIDHHHAGRWRQRLLNIGGIQPPITGARNHRQPCTPGAQGRAVGA